MFLIDCQFYYYDIFNTMNILCILSKTHLVWFILRKEINYEKCFWKLLMVIYPRDLSIFDMTQPLSIYHVIYRPFWKLLWNETQTSQNLFTCRVLTGNKNMWHSIKIIILLI